MRQPNVTIERPRRNGSIRAVEGREHARQDALRWLASQLDWERTLDRLRCDESEQAAAAA
jgi:hypothetical protein